MSENVIHARDARRSAVFPLEDGDVVVQMPHHITREGLDDLEAYWAVMMKVLRARDTDRAKTQGKHSE